MTRQQLYDDFLKHGAVTWNGRIVDQFRNLPNEEEFNTQDLGLRIDALEAGNTLYVDAVNGNNSTATRTSGAFLTLTAAKTAAQSGDTIVVRPGTYNDTDLLKNGVNWHFEAGAIVTASGLVGIFDDTASGANGAIISQIGGAGNFLCTNACNPIKISNAASVVQIEAGTIQSVSGVAVDLKGGSAYLRVNRLISTAYDTIGASGGTHYIDAQSIVAGGDAITTEGASLAGRTFIKCHSIIGDTLFNAEGFGEVWLDCMRAAPVSETILSAGGVDDVKFIMRALEFNFSGTITLGAIRSRFIGTRFSCAGISLEGNGATLENCTIVASGTNSITAGVGTTLQIHGTCATNKVAGGGVTLSVGSLSVDADVS